MRERRQAHEAATLKQLRALQKRVEERALADAQTQAAARAIEVEQAHREADEALESWSSAALGGSLNPEQLALLSADVYRRDREVASATDAHEREKNAARRQQDRFAESTVRLTQSEEVARRLNRRLARRIEEHRQTALEERITYAWCCHD